MKNIKKTNLVCQSCMYQSSEMSRKAVFIFLSILFILMSVFLFRIGFCMCETLRVYGIKFVPYLGCLFTSKKIIYPLMYLQKDYYYFLNINGGPRLCPSWTFCPHAFLLMLVLLLALYSLSRGDVK